MKLLCVATQVACTWRAAVNEVRGFAGWVRRVPLVASAWVVGFMFGLVCCCAQKNGDEMRR